MSLGRRICGTPVDIEPSFSAASSSGQDYNTLVIKAREHDQTRVVPLEPTEEAIGFVLQFDDAYSTREEAMEFYKKLITLAAAPSVEPNAAAGSGGQDRSTTHSQECPADEHCQSAAPTPPITVEQALALIEQETLDALGEKDNADYCQWSAAYVLACAYRRRTGELSALRASLGEPVYVIFDGPPSHKSGRFVEVETAEGKSVSAGEWKQCGSSGYWQLGPFYAPPTESDG